MKKLSLYIIVLIALSSCKKNAAALQQVTQTEVASNSMTLCPNSIACSINSAAMVQRDSAVTGAVLYTNINYGSYPVFKAERWFAPGHIFESRSLIKFNLPANFFTGFNFCQAYLLLKENPDPNSVAYFGIANPYFVSQANNKAYIVRVVNNWNQNVVTWNTKPAATTVNAALVPAIVTGSGYVAGSDQASVNVTQIMQNVQTQGFDYGLAMAMQTNAVLNAARQFGSNTAATPLQAQLVFYY